MLGIISFVQSMTLVCTAFTLTPRAHHRRLDRRDANNSKTVATSLYDHLRIKEWTSLGGSLASAPGRDALDLNAMATSPFDHSWIKEWASLGDSFASAPGAGKRENWWCSRYDGAYGNLINNDNSLGTGNRKFHFIPCLGYTSKQILDNEVNTLPDASQMTITLSAGRNDAEFSELVDGCIFQYNKRWSECDPQLQRSRDIIESENFSKDLDKLIQGSIKKLAYSL